MEVLTTFQSLSSDGPISPIRLSSTSMLSSLSIFPIFLKVPGMAETVHRNRFMPARRTNPTGSHENQLKKPNWPDAEFPWRLRTEERNEEAKALQEEQLRWIERYLDRDSDEEDDDQM